jgi:hypothetical protein
LEEKKKKEKEKKGKEKKKKKAYDSSAWVPLDAQHSLLVSLQGEKRLL